MTLGEIDTGDPYSPIRWWIYQTLQELFPNSGTVIDSINNKQKFLQWTGVDQKYMEDQWAAGSRFTSCTSFLSILASKISAAGGVAGGKLRPFQMYIHPGWHWFGEEDTRPQSGDFYMLGVRGGATQHVGVVYDIIEDSWTTVDAGQGGKNSGFDCIKRRGPRAFPDGPLVGWLDVE